MPDDDQHAPGALPNLVVIGAMKCGSTSLHHYLDAHPEISMSEHKEINFFYRPQRWRKGTDWYRDHFDPRAPVRGESSVNYTKSPAASSVAARRMRDLLGDVKLIYLVRNPIHRSISHYHHTYAKGEEARPLADALADLGGQYVSRSLFYANLEPFFEYFTVADLLVIPQERLGSQRLETLRFIFSFLGIDPDVATPEFSTMWQTTASKLGSDGGDGSGTDRTAVAAAALDPNLRSTLINHFRPDVKRVRRVMPAEFRRSLRLR